MSVFAAALDIVETHGWRRITETRGALQTNVTLHEAVGLARRRLGGDLTAAALMERLEALLEGPALDTWHDAPERAAADIAALLRRATRAAMDTLEPAP
ncbi:hypothetical protein MARCHEWKA_03480 [Brevundimonas phage vB_BpoS-Marchewka]|uniref:Uncharacterized protein n=1 Tax=Brevundimonas phage vB_BpoS-Marchewka TaxID=2948604 RepID=A0A9E7N4E9_9CAUD|nr:hypothetical protein MARCHEWKA_03480 [Brevundimonas phage vB_BpoS-Marchewka]UTC29306.1 hypothetical protein BAMBUS_02240 [Brevundimonas phage vB_BpoS-Bambus]